MLIQVDHSDLARVLASSLRSQLFKLGLEPRTVENMDKVIEDIARVQTQAAMLLDKEAA